MVRRDVIWTANAERQLRRISKYFTKRNKSGHYSVNLYLKFQRELEAVAKEPGIGIKTQMKQVRGLIVGNYILYYQIFEKKIMVLKVWDSRQNPKKLDILK